MEGLFKKLIVDNFQKKFFSLLAAVAIWIFVNNSITSTKVFTRVPIRVVNLPVDKTIRGLMPNGVLERKMTITLTGTRDVIDRLDSQDFEVVIDASDKGDEWVVQVSKKNLVSLNPDIELMHNITHLSHGEFVIHLSRLITEKIPVYIMPPKGEPPEGYQFLDIWPQKLFHVVSGPEEDVKRLQEQGLEICFDLSTVSKDDLDSLSGDSPQAPDEVSFIVPESWKKVRIPFLNNSLQSINGQEAKHLRIDFLRKSLLQIDLRVPVRIFYPVSTINRINPQVLSLEALGIIMNDRSVSLIDSPLYVSDVSRLFLDIVKDRIEVVIVPELRDNTYLFSYQVQFIDPKVLEDEYILRMMPPVTAPAVEASSGGAMQRMLSKTQASKSSPTVPMLNSYARQHQAMRENFLRTRFREYMQRFQLLFGKSERFEVDFSVNDGKVTILPRIMKKPVFVDGDG